MGNMYRKFREIWTYVFETYEQTNSFITDSWSKFGGIRSSHKGF